MLREKTKLGEPESTGIGKLKGLFYLERKVSKDLWGVNRSSLFSAGQDSWGVTDPVSQRSGPLGAFWGCEEWKREKGSCPFTYRTGIRGRTRRFVGTGPDGLGFVVGRGWASQGV